MQVLNLKLQACPFTMLRPDLPGVLLGALVNLRVLDLDLASFAPPVAHPADGEQSLQRSRLSIVPFFVLFLLVMWFICGCVFSIVHPIVSSLLVMYVLSGCVFSIRQYDKKCACSWSWSVSCMRQVRMGTRCPRHLRRTQPAATCCQPASRASPSCRTCAWPATGGAPRYPLGGLPVMLQLACQHHSIPNGNSGPAAAEDHIRNSSLKGARLPC